MRRIVFPLFLALLCSACPRRVRAHDGEDHGSSAVTADFLRTGPGARAAAMGEAQAAAVDDASALYWNPAALSRVERFGAVFSHSQMAESIAQEYAAVGAQVSSGVAVGAHVQYMGYGRLTGADDAGLETGEFRPNDLAVGLGAAVRAENGWAAGAAVKLVRMTLRETASTAAADAGVLTPAFMGGALRLGASVANLGGRIKFRETREKLPVIGRAGLALRLSERVWAAADGVKETERDAYANGGLEALLSNPGSAVSLFGRAGFTSRDWARRSGMEGATAGVGLGVSGLRVDYAFVVRPGDPGHRASLLARF